MRLVDAVERERTPYERAWRRAQRTGLPALYFMHGRWHVAGVPGDGSSVDLRAAWMWLA